MWKTNAKSAKRIEQKRLQAARDRERAAWAPSGKK